MRKVLDLGCGNDKYEDYVYYATDEVIGLDIQKGKGVDVVHDLEKKLPFKDEEFDGVYCHSTLQYISNIEQLIKEVHRVMKKDGFFLVQVPYFSSVMAYAYPQVKSRFGYSTFSNKGYHSFGNLFEPIKIEIGFGKLYRWMGMKSFANKFPRTYEKYLCWIFPAQTIKYELQKK